MTTERRYNSESFIINFGPHDPRDHDWQCPAILHQEDGRKWRCNLVIRAGRTKHLRAHEWQPLGV